MGRSPVFNLPQDKPLLTLGDVANEIVYLYCFQSWCPGCLQRGFPTLLSVRDNVEDGLGVAFVAIQTVFEGFDVNTLERAKEVAQHYELKIPFGRVRFNDFHAEAEEMTPMIRQMHEEVI